MTVPAWWSSYGDSQIARGAVGIDIYECKWICNLRDIHAGDTDQKSYFIASLDIRRRVDDALVFEEDIKLDAHDLFASSGNNSRFSGMEFEVEKHMTKRAELVVKQLTKTR